MIDHRASPGIPGTPNLVEAATITCHHCHRQIIRNPGRVRPRAHCWGCDRDICDGCAVNAQIHGCVPLDKIIEKHMRSNSNIRIL